MDTKSFMRSLRKLKFPDMSSKKSRLDLSMGLSPSHRRKAVPSGSGLQKNVSSGDKKLSGKLVFLDIKDLQRARCIEWKLNKLGAVIEDFLSKDIHFVISSSNSSKLASQTGPQGQGEGLGSVSPLFTSTPSPYTPSATPSPTYVNAKGKLVPLTRGQTMAQMARARNRSPSPSSVVASAGKLGIKIVPIEAADRWLDKELRRLGLRTTEESQRSQDTASAQHKHHAKMRQLKDPFIKVESVTRKFCPQAKLLSAWPHINLDTKATTCPFDGKGAINEPQVKSNKSASAGYLLSADSRPAHRRSLEGEDGSRMVAVPILTAGDLRRQQEKRKQEQRRRGYCECCGVKYEDMGEHLKEASHLEFARDKNNYEVLDELISQLPTTSDFLRNALLRHCKGQAAGKPSTSASDQKTDVDSSSSSDGVLTLNYKSPSKSCPPQASDIRLTASRHDLEQERGFCTPTHTPQHLLEKESTMHSPCGSHQGHPAAAAAQHPEAAQHHDTPVNAENKARDAGQTAPLPAVVIRRPGARSAYGSPRDKWNVGPSPSHRDAGCTPKKIRERSMVFGNTSIGSLKSVSDIASPMKGMDSVDAHDEVHDTVEGCKISVDELQKEASVNPSPVKKKRRSAICVESKLSMRHSQELRGTEIEGQVEKPVSADPLGDLRNRQELDFQGSVVQSSAGGTESGLTSEQEEKASKTEKKASFEGYPASVTMSVPMKPEHDTQHGSQTPTQDTVSNQRSRSRSRASRMAPDAHQLDVQEVSKITSQQQDFVQSPIQSPAAASPRRTPRKRQPGPRTSTPTRSETPQKNRFQSPYKNMLQTPEKNRYHTPQKGKLGCLQKEKDPGEESDVCSSPVYHQEQTHTSTTLVIPVRRLRSTERVAAESSADEENKSTPKKKCKRMILADDSEWGPSSSTSKSRNRSASKSTEREGRTTRQRSSCKTTEQSNSSQETPREDRAYYSYRKSSDSCNADGNISTQNGEDVSLRMKLVRCGFSPPPQTCTKKVKLSRRWKLVSDHSMSRLLHSETENSSFAGFEGNEDLPSDLSYELASEVEISDDETREWLIDEAENKNCSMDEQDDRSLKNFIPTFSSPGKRSDSSWEDACDLYLSQSVEQQLQSKGRHPGSPRKASRVLYKRKHRDDCSDQDDGGEMQMKRRKILEKSPVKGGQSDKTGMDSPTKSQNMETRRGSSRHKRRVK